MHAGPSGLKITAKILLLCSDTCKEVFGKRDINLKDY